jgi:monoamine oxidase
VQPANRSLWVATTSETAYPQLEGNVEVDVAVVGGGITGTVTAWLLKEAGLRVGLIEMNHAGDGTTGYTTASSVGTEPTGHGSARAMGSRFSKDGTLLQGPATEPLPKHAL